MANDLVDSSSEFNSFDDVEYYDIDLAIVDNSGGQFRTTSPRPPRGAIAIETGILVRYGLVDTIHGMLSDSNQLCSLIVLDFQFDIIKPSRAIHRVNVDVLISDQGGEIGIVAPSDRISINPRSREVNNTIGLQAGYSGVNANAQKSTKLEKVGYATVKGWAGYEPRSRQLMGLPSNCAKWVMLENPQAKDGVPARIRVAFQLLRNNYNTFELDIIFNVEADWRTKLEAMFAATPPTFPLIIDPRARSTNRTVKQYNEDKLELVELKDLFKVSYGSLVETFSNSS